MVLGENLDRTDLSPWEWALAFRGRRDRLRERGEPSGVRDVAASLRRRAFQTVGEYLQVADALGPELLAGAGVAAGGEPDHARLARLPLAALLRVARASGRGATAGAQRLLQELKRAGDPAAGALLREREAALAGGSRDGGRDGLQLNIRQALEDVAPRQAAGYLARLAPAVRVLAARAALDPASDRAPIAAALEEALGELRGGGGPPGR
jgi:hypothetical protein